MFCRTSEAQALLREGVDAQCEVADSVSTALVERRFKLCCWMNVSKGGRGRCIHFGAGRLETTERIDRACSLHG